MLDSMCHHMRTAVIQCFKCFVFLEVNHDLYIPFYSGRATEKTSFMHKDACQRGTTLFPHRKGRDTLCGQRPQAVSLLIVQETGSEVMVDGACPFSASAGLSVIALSIVSSSTPG